MAYSAPELLLVGAAQNLVLGESATNEAGVPCEDLGREDSKGLELEYDSGALW